MISWRKKVTYVYILIILLSQILPFVQSEMVDTQVLVFSSIDHDEIICCGLEQNTEPSVLEQWYITHEQIKFASLVSDTMTIQFIDGFTLVLFDVTSLLINAPISKIENKHSLLDLQSHYCSEVPIGNSALLLNPSEYLYGNRHCRKMINTLLNNGYNIEYFSNEDVDISFLRYNLTSDIVYMNTHAGYWDVNGDKKSGSIVIATGEYWTNETELMYPFEYNHKLIVKGMVGTQSFVCFTPAFIDYYYDPYDMPDSLIYMATCHAGYDESMATAFLDSGARTYIGWTQDTFFWINSRTSVQSFRLFSLGFTAKQVCTLIGYGGFFNFVFKSKLTYYGDKEYTILHH